MNRPSHELGHQLLRDVVAQRLDLVWSDFAEAHPNLAKAIERVELVELAVEDLAADPEYRKALEAAAVDEHTLNVAARLLQDIDHWVRRALGV